MNATHGQEVDAAARSRARRRALQAIYAWQIGDQDMNAIIDQFRREQDMGNVDVAYFDQLLKGVEARCDELDAALTQHMDRAVNAVDPIERAVLRLGAWELKTRPDVPYRVVLDEAVEIAKRFGAEHGHTYVNGVLDKLVGQWRTGSTA